MNRRSAAAASTPLRPGAFDHYGAHDAYSPYTAQRTAEPCDCMDCTGSRDSWDGGRLSRSRHEYNDAFMYSLPRSTSTSDPRQ
eukprot:3280-Eustigmatos_ZCMA.PRE.1